MTPSLRAKVLHEWQPYTDLEAWSPRAGISIPNLIPGVMKRLGLEERLRQSQVFHHWQSIVGDSIAIHAQPVSLRKGRLIITVDHPIWLQELSRSHKPLILEKVQQTIGKKTVREIVFRIG